MATESVEPKPRSYGKEIILIGILAFTLITAFVVFVRTQSLGDTGCVNCHIQGQPVYLWGYVLIGSKGTPYYLYFDNSVTGRITGYVGSDKNYSANLLSGYTYAVTLQYYVPSTYQYVTCTPTPSTITPYEPSASSSSVRQDFSC